MEVVRVLGRTIAERVDHVVGKFTSGGWSIIATATGNETMNASVTATSTETSHKVIYSTLDVLNERQEAARTTNFFGIKHLRGYGAILAYFQSKWALGTVVITTPNFATLRYGDPEKSFPLDFATSGGRLYKLISAVIFWQDARDSCATAKMIGSTQISTAPSGSLSLLWPFFQSLCLSKFIETLSCAVQGNTPQTETSMTIFEHSLAFSEARAMIASRVERVRYRGSNGTSTSHGVGNSTLTVAAAPLDQSALLNMANATPEVLLIALISSLNHISTNILGVLGMQGRFRLLNTGVWGLCYIITFIWSVFHFATETSSQSGILGYPTACIVGYVPHILILVGICICSTIYILALLLSAISPPEGLSSPRSLRERLTMARHNMQGNVHLSMIHIDFQEDFYTTLLKIGFAAMTAASEVVFLNEGRSVNVHQLTWLEKDRLQEIISTRQHQVRGNKSELQNLQRATSEDVANGVGLFNVFKGDLHHASGWKSGYSNEQKPKALRSGTRPNGAGVTGDGVGVLQRGGRWIMAVEFFKGIFWLTAGWMAIALTSAFEKVGIAWRPPWLSRLAGEGLKTNKDQAKPHKSRLESLEFWLLSDDGKLSLPCDDNVDVEAETRKRLQYGYDGWGRQQEKDLDSRLYGWWSHGGWWGERDGSGEYWDERPDDDTTSVVSISSAATETDRESDDGDGRRTPTQEDPYPGSRETTPVFDSTLDIGRLARLLNPTGPEEREESEMLARHLSSDRIMTRSEYRGLVEREKSKVLTSTRYLPGTSVIAKGTGKLGPDDEAELLEQLIVTRRSFHAATADAGSEDSGLGGPQCEGGIRVFEDLRALTV
ncbi:MAG: hypothetical protein M1835_002685 [Candelina submexicana]|nr:MAG: hypothetical protein M1835_002685 [Candelina submexicana]